MEEIFIPDHYWDCKGNCNSGRIIIQFEYRFYILRFNGCNNRTGDSVSLFDRLLSSLAIKKNSKEIQRNYDNCRVRQRRTVPMLNHIDVMLKKNVEEVVFNYGQSNRFGYIKEYSFNDFFSKYIGYDDRYWQAEQWCNTNTLMDIDERMFIKKELWDLYRRNNSDTIQDILNSPSKTISLTEFLTKKIKQL